MPQNLHLPCRWKEHPELRGKTDQDNLQIMALAIASIAARWFRTVSVNEKQLMDMYGITAKQLKNAKKVIMQHYQERVNQGWAAPPQQLRQPPLARTSWTRSSRT